MHKEIELISKRNRVLRIIEGDESWIRKEFKVMKRFSAEAGMLKVLKAEGIRVPKILKVGPDHLLLEDLGDWTLLDWFEKAEEDNLENYESMIQGMVDFLREFYIVSHKVFGEPMVMYDMNFRNFIVREDALYRVDLEQTCKGSIESDIGKLLAFATTYHPPGTDWKMKFRDRLFEQLTDALVLHRETVLEEEMKEYREMNSRRMKEDIDN
jgi:hypothetical protein